MMLQVSLHTRVYHEVIRLLANVKILNEIRAQGVVVVTTNRVVQRHDEAQRKNMQAL